MPKAASATTILTGGNSYSGSTAVSAGVLELAAAAQGPVISGGGADISGGEIVFDYVAGSDPAATIQGLLAASYNGGLWNTGQFRSSTARATADLGWVDDTVNNKVTVAYALYGDSDWTAQSMERTSTRCWRITTRPAPPGIGRLQLRRRR